MLHLPLHFPSLLFLLIIFLTCVTDAVPDKTLKLVQVVHRHGARSPDVKYNMSLICGEVPCDYLNPAGFTMLIKTGSFLRKRYNTDLNVISEPFFPSEDYNLDISSTRSTDVYRTLQSADAFLRGLFPNMTAYSPAIHTVPKGKDTLLRSDTIPFIYAFKELDKDGVRKLCNPVVDSLFNRKKLLDIAAEAHYDGYCLSKKKRCNCARKLADIAVSYQADGRIGKFPLLQANLEKLRSVTEFYYQIKYGYNTSDETHIKMGTQGQPIAQQLLSNARDHIAGTTSFKLFHYSAHETTLSPLAATLGDISSRGISPPFGQLYTFELLLSESENTYYMRVLRTSPGQTLETKYEVNWEEFQLKCMNSDDLVYNAVNNTCPLKDFERFVNSTKGTDVAGLCYLNNDYKALFNCPLNDNEEPNSDCVFYRTLCPQQACNTSDGYVLNSLTQRCVCLNDQCKTDLFYPFSPVADPSAISRHDINKQNIKSQQKKKKEYRLLVQLLQLVSPW